jgi:signal transduction protein with GAF and PtsI domain
MAPPGIPAVKFLVRAMKMSAARTLATEVLGLTSAKEIYSKCKEFNRLHMPKE